MYWTFGIRTRRRMLRVREVDDLAGRPGAGEDRAVRADDQRQDLGIGGVVGDRPGRARLGLATEDLPRIARRGQDRAVGRPRQVPHPGCTREPTDATEWPSRTRPVSEITTDSLCPFAKAEGPSWRQVSTLASAGMTASPPIPHPIRRTLRTGVANEAGPRRRLDPNLSISSLVVIGSSRADRPGVPGIHPGACVMRRLTDTTITSALRP